MLRSALFVTRCLWVFKGLKCSYFYAIPIVNMLIINTYKMLITEFLFLLQCNENLRHAAIEKKTASLTTVVVFVVIFVIVDA